MKLSFQVLSATMIALCCAGQAIAQDTGRTVRAASRTMSESATVDAVDVPNRTVVLSEPGGRKVNLKVSDRVKNLPQLRPGDQVVVKYQEAVAVRLHKSGVEPGASVMAGTSTANPGEKPGAVGARQITVVAPIVAIDNAKPSVTLRGADGNLVEAAVENPANLRDVNVGDKIEITYTEAVAVSVTSPQEAMSGASSPTMSGTSSSPACETSSPIASGTSKTTAEDLNREELDRIRRGC